MLQKTTADNTATGSVPIDTSLLKDEPQTRARQLKSEAVTPKIDTSTTDVKETDIKDEADEPDTAGQIPEVFPEDTQDVADAQPPDSEDSLSQQHVANELRRLAELRVSATLAEARVRVTGDPSQISEGGAVAPDAEETTNPVSARNIQGAVAPESGWNWEDNESYAPSEIRKIPG